MAVKTPQPKAAQSPQPGPAALSQRKPKTRVASAPVRVDALLAFAGSFGSAVLPRQVRSPVMAYFKAPRGMGPKDWGWVSCSKEVAHLLDFHQVQEDLYKRYPELKSAYAPLPRKSRGTRASYFRLVLQSPEHPDTKLRVFFTVYGSRPHEILRCLTVHWRNRKVPWVRIISSDGDSAHLPDWALSANYSAA